VLQIFSLFVFIRIPGCLPNEYEYSNYSNYSNYGYSNENFSKNAQSKENILLLKIDMP
jgi:hypothetical protein